MIDEITNAAVMIAPDIKPGWTTMKINWRSMIMLSGQSGKLLLKNLVIGGWY